MEESIDWLLNGPAYIHYLTKRDLLKETDLENERSLMLEDQRISSLIDNVKKWPWTPLGRHNDAKHQLHKFVFLSELGIQGELDHVCDSILSTMDPGSPPRINTKLYKRWMGRDGEEYLWFLCDAPLQLYALAGLGFRDNDMVLKAVDMLASHVKENGWRCISDESLGSFKGPGPRESVCPYSTLLMMRLLSRFRDQSYDKVSRIGAEALLQRWELKGTEKPFLFGIGTDFRKLKAPLIWYDILHMTEVLSHFDFVHRDDRFREMIETILSKEIEGRYRPESVWMAWKDWDMGQKKVPSYYITYKVLGILERTGNWRS